MAQLAAYAESGVARLTSAQSLRHESIHMNSARLAIALSAALVLPARAAENAPMTASQLAAKLSAQQEGVSYVRLRMDIKGATNETLQLQVKQRRTKGGAEVVYQVLWPKERKGESVLVRKSGGRASGSIFTPPNEVRAIDGLSTPLLGSDLALEDVVEDFFAWDQQSFAGTEEVDGVKCQILESKPGKNERSIYGSVRSWIDLRRMVPLRVEKLSRSGQVVRRVDTTRVVADAGHHIPANLTIRARGVTQLDGSRIKHDVAFTDRDFSVEGLREITTPRGSPE